MNDLRNAILATLAYYDIFDYPLTGLEIYEWLISPARFRRSPQGISEITVGEIVSQLENLSKSGKIESYNGFYALPTRAGHLYNLRSERYKIAIHKFKKLLRAAYWLQVVPYLRGLFVSGSLVISNSAPSGDFDMLTVTKSGRLYTCRMLLSVLTSLMRMRRTRHDVEATDKFCFNHYLVEDSLEIKHESIYTADIYSHLMPIFGRENIDERFFASNLWLNKYFYNFRPVTPSTKRRVHRSFFLDIIAKFLEKILNTRLGDIFEKFMRQYQQSRIRKNPVNNEPGGRVIYSDVQLEFHPRSFEAIVIRRYNESLERLGIHMPTQEQDSGLRIFTHVL